MNLSNIRGIYKENYTLSHLTWFKVGGKADFFFKPEDEEDLIAFLKENNGKKEINIIGAGSNLIIRDGGVEGVIIKLGKNFTAIEAQENSILVGAGCLNFNLAKFALAHNIKNMEFLIGIPGTVGGGIAMNAGSYGFEFKDIVKAVHTVDFLGNKNIISVDDIGFSYRKNSLPKNLIFTKVELKRETGIAREIQEKMQSINAQRTTAQPTTARTGGSTFANPPDRKAWELIDRAGLRGKTIGGASMSTLHCNFIINNGNATAADIENLGNFVQEEVKKQTGAELRWEIIRIGRHAAI